MKWSWRYFANDLACLFAVFLAIGARATGDYSLAMFLTFIAGALFENRLRR